MKKAPSRADFPSHLTLTITHPPHQSPETSQPNILLLLHGLGDTASSFTSFAQALHLPETTIVTLQAPHPLPFDLPGAHWGDDLTFDAASGGGAGGGSSSGPDMDMDGGFTRATRVLNEVLDVLVRTCGYAVSEVLVFGFGQGGMAGLCAAREVSSGSTSGSSNAGAGRAGSLSGVVSIGAPYPLSASTTGPKSRTPVLLVCGRDSTAVSDSAERRTKQVFEFVETHRYARRGDGMPRNRDEMFPVMRFLATRLRSWRGVPEGSVEL